MTLREILRAKGRSIFTIDPAATLMDVACKLGELNIGSLVVLDEHRDLVGIITERDILRAVARQRAPLATLRVDEHMTRDTVTASPDQSLTEVMGLMTEHRIRHLPVIEQGELMGLVSIGDIVKAQHDQLSLENHYMRNYIQSQ